MKSRRSENITKEARHNQEEGCDHQQGSMGQLPPRIHTALRLRLQTAQDTRTLHAQQHEAKDQIATSSPRVGKPRWPPDDDEARDLQERRDEKEHQGTGAWATPNAIVIHYRKSRRTLAAKNASRHLNDAALETIWEIEKSNSIKPGGIHGI
jgi:hypothetical protein